MSISVGFRTAANLTMREAAACVGCTNPSIHMWETGKRQPPRPKTLMKIAAAYGSDPAELLRRAGYLFPYGKRKERLWKEDAAEVLKDPSVKAYLDQRYAPLKPALRRAAQVLENQVSLMQSARAVISEGFKKAFAEFDESYRDLFEDPDILFTAHFKDKPPKLPLRVQYLLTELYRLYLRERQQREELERLLELEDREK